MSRDWRDIDPHGLLAALQDAVEAAHPVRCGCPRQGSSCPHCGRPCVGDHVIRCHEASIGDRP